MTEHSLCGGQETIGGCVCSLATAGVGPRSSLAIAAPGASCSGCRVVLDTGAAAGPQAVVKRLSLHAVGKGCKVPRLFTCTHTQTEQIWVFLRPTVSTARPLPEPGHPRHTEHRQRSWFA